MPPVIAIDSIGEMGAGIGGYLKSRGYKVITNLSLRSDHTVQRATAAGIEDVGTDDAVVNQADYLLSIVPPRDAVFVARRIVQALTKNVQRLRPLYYLDLNAISPTTVSSISAILTQHHVIKYVDGGIIGMPPQLKCRSGEMSSDKEATWQLPSLPVSGPHIVQEPLATDLNIRHISSEWGPASGLKMCFASLTKGFTAIAIQSLTTAHSLGILGELKVELTNHSLLERVQVGVAGCPPKAYRWVREMDEIAETFAASGFGQAADMRGGGLFNAIADVYRFIAEDVAMRHDWIDLSSDTRADLVAAECVKAIKLE